MAPFGVYRPPRMLRARCKTHLDPARPNRSNHWGSGVLNMRRKAWRFPLLAPSPTGLSPWLGQSHPPSKYTPVCSGDAGELPDGYISRLSEPRSDSSHVPTTIRTDPYCPRLHTERHIQARRPAGAAWS